MVRHDAIVCSRGIIVVLAAVVFSFALDFGGMARDAAPLVLIPAFVVGLSAGFLRTDRIRRDLERHGVEWKRYGRLRRVALVLAPVAISTLIWTAGLASRDDQASGWFLAAMYAAGGFSASLIVGTYLLERHRSIRLWVTYYPTSSDPEYVSYYVAPDPGRSASSANP
jgi:hypothetical protein